MFLIPVKWAFRLGLVAAVLWGGVSSPAAVGRDAENANAMNVGGLLSAAEGEALVEFAVDAATGLRPRPDCSHLVHLLYSRAGLKYPYQESRVLYRGVPDFERVKKPQPGDLIVWRGHVGIVVSPRSRLFLSSVRSGIVTETWTSDQWIARGHPRFFRYRIGPDSNLEQLATVSRRGNSGRSDTAVMSSSDTGDDTDSDTVVHSAANSSVRAAAPTGMETESNNLPSTSFSAATNEEADQQEDGWALHDDSSIDEKPAVVAVIRQRNKPNKREIMEAFKAGSNAAARTLISQEVATDRPLTVFTRVDVSRIKIRNESGTVTVKLTESMSLEQGRVVPAKTIERELAISRQTGNGSSAWVISDPHQRTYIPEPQALKVFQRQAELLLHRAPNSPATRATVKALNQLYEQQPAETQRTSLK